MKKIINDLKVKYKVGGGFFLMALVLLFAVVITVHQVKKTNEITNKVIDLRVPTAMASLNVLNGINHSLAALRGWIILGKDKFKKERAVAWTDEIEASINKLKVFSKNWTNPENIKSLKEIEGDLKKFKKYQQEIEDISGSPENRPALNILLVEAAPQANILVNSITNMINLESKEAATPERKALLGMMADTRGTTARGLANIRAYLLSGNPTFSERFQTMWKKNEVRFGDLTNNAHLLTAKQKKEFDNFTAARKIFSPLPPKMFEIRSGEEWNLANLWLGTKAAPTAFKLKKALLNMNVNQKLLMTSDMNLAKEKSSSLINLEWILLVSGLCLCLIIGFLITQSVTAPLKDVIAVANKISEGNLTQRLNLARKDELGDLSVALNGMIESQVSMVANIQDMCVTLQTSNDDLSNVSTDIQEDAGNTKSQAESVASATEEMSSNINSMASATEEMNVNINTVSSSAEEMSSNMNSVASSIEEMSTTIKDVAENAREASVISEKGATMSETVKGQMSLLDKAGQEIGKVTEVIKKIAEQTNLLALNATIEAASAGDAGKGFAVVAGEIKDLANQSAQAAEDIAQKIEGVQVNTKNSVELIDDVAAVIVEVNNAVNTITSAVEQQEEATVEISKNVAESNEGSNSIASAIAEIGKGTGDLSQNAAEASKGATEVSSSIQEVSEVVSNSGVNVNKLKEVADSMVSVSASLGTLMDSYQLDVVT